MRLSQLPVELVHSAKQSQGKERIADCITLHTCTESVQSFNQQQETNKIKLTATSIPSQDWQKGIHWQNKKFFFFAIFRFLFFFFLSFSFFLCFFFSLLTVDCCCQKKQKRKKKKEEKRSQKMPRGVPVTLLCYVHRSVTEVGNRRRRWVGGRVGGGWRHYVRITGRVALVATIPCEWWASWRRPCADCTSETAAEGTTPATSAETRPCGRRNGPSSPATAARWVEWVGRETAATSPVPSATMAEL